MSEPLWCVLWSLTPSHEWIAMLFVEALPRSTRSLLSSECACLTVTRFSSHLLLPLLHLPSSFRLRHDYIGAYLNIPQRLWIPHCIFLKKIASFPTLLCCASLYPWYSLAVPLLISCILLDDPVLCNNISINKLIVRSWVCLIFLWYYSSSGLLTSTWRLIFETH